MSNRMLTNKFGAFYRAEVLVCLTLLSWNFATGAERNHKRPVKMPNLRTKNLVCDCRKHILIPQSSVEWLPRKCRNHTI